LVLIGASLAILHAGGVQVCLFHRLSGWPCLTCGASRAAVLLAKGHPLQAFLMQPLMVAAGCAVGLWLLVYSFHLVALRQRVALRFLPRERRVLVFLILILAAANWGFLMVQRI
jgi:hypothetical protein